MSGKFQTEQREWKRNGAGQEDKMVAVIRVKGSVDDKDKL